MIGLLVLLPSCEHRGGIDELCLPDGTCAPALVCHSVANSFNHHCITPESVRELIQAQTPVLRPLRCRFESECFCTTCADKCVKGVKNCTYSDTSVWGSKPSVCECQL